VSNVLIGIIGVILFIGLALAGALFLGPRFQESTNNSRASAAVQAVSQVAHAVNMRELQEGRPMMANESIAGQLINERYLKSLPSNPTGSSDVFLADVNGAGFGTGKALTVVMRMHEDGNGKAICEAIRRQTGALTSPGPWTPTAQSFLPANMVNPTGCQWDGGTYYAYARI
jgi:hypothetical protein